MLYTSIYDCANGKGYSYILLTELSGQQNIVLGEIIYDLGIESRKIFVGDISAKFKVIIPKLWDSL